MMDKKSPGDKQLAKILRFYIELIHRWGSATIKGVKDEELENYFIGPFWLAIQLDKAYQTSPQIAMQYIEELKRRKQLPETIKTIEHAAEYLASFLTKAPFYYRHAPTTQFEQEESWVEE